ncbi:MAG TPA: TetR/AcrR family transcriptional regulator [Nocardioides sp.]|nr:TetR/AcrR family transcriptional regulator [Nocardioides sp.]
MCPRPVDPDVTSADGRDTRWNDHRAQRHELILQAAMTAIERDGGDVGVAVIAEEAGVPRSVVYRLFKNREDLDEQIRTRIIEDLMGVLAPTLDPSGRLRDAIRLAVETYVGWVAEHPRLHQFLGTGSATGPRAGSRVVSRSRTAVAVSVRELVELHLVHLLEGAAPPPALSENLAFGIIGLVDGTVNRWVALADKRSSPEDLTTFLAEGVWALLASTASLHGLKLDRRMRVVPPA